MLKTVGFIACAVALSVFCVRYNAGWKRRSQTIFEIFFTVRHICEKMAAFPDTLHKMLSDYEPTFSVGEEIKESVLGFCRAGQGDVLNGSINEYLSAEHRDRFISFIKELGTADVSSERARCESARDYFSEESERVKAKREESEKLSKTLTACALGGLLMLII